MSYKTIEQYLTPNKYSRPQTALKSVKGIVVHWVANPNTSASSNRNFFENRKNGKSNFGSAHEVIDLNGDIVLCLPKNEMAYHVGSSLPYRSGSTQVYTPNAWEKLNTHNSTNIKPNPNDCTYGIECTHIDWNGKMTDATYNTLVERVADLCIEFNLDPTKDVYTHQEVVGWKNCHKWFVDHPDEWKLFKDKVKTMMANKLHPKKTEVVEKIMQSISKYFSDVDAKWSVDAIDRGKERGIFTVPPDKAFHPTDNITRQEFAVALDRAIDFIINHKE